MSSARLIDRIATFRPTISLFSRRTIVSALIASVLVISAVRVAAARFGSVSGLFDFIGGQRVLLTPSVASGESQYVASTPPHFYSASFRIDNFTTEDIVIKKVKAACGCLTLSVKGDGIIPAGEHRDVPLAIKLRERALKGSRKEIIFITSPPQVICAAIAFDE
jgi:hypothetical protein